MNKPLVTFALFAYNQERYIREALAGALAQTYTPLQIILSDDNSSDKTFAIMQEVASQYHGPHQILLNRNQPNLGIGAHVNKVMSLAQGEFIVVAAGDDISLPERTAILADKWIELGQRAISVHTSTQQIDEAGHELEIVKPSKAIETFTPGCILGATHGWSAESFVKFGDLGENSTIEDIVIAFRSSLLDGVYFIDQPLVKYRIGGISSWQGIQRKERKIGQWRRWSALYQQMLNDLNKIYPEQHPLRETLLARTRVCSTLLAMSASQAPLAVAWQNKAILFNRFFFNEAMEYYLPFVFRVMHAIRRRVMR